MTDEQEARVLAQQFGTRMCDENGDTHGEELYCLGLDDIGAMKVSVTQELEQENRLIRARNDRLQTELSACEKEVDQLKARVKLLEEECAWLNSVGKDK